MNSETSRFSASTVSQPRFEYHGGTSRARTVQVRAKAIDRVYLSGWGIDTAVMPKGPPVIRCGASQKKNDYRNKAQEDPSHPATPTPLRALAGGGRTHGCSIAERKSRENGGNVEKTAIGPSTAIADAAGGRPSRRLGLVLRRAHTELTLVLFLPIFQFGLLTNARSLLCF